MNVRKLTDYSAMFTALDELMVKNLPQMELYRNIGSVVSGRSEKGAAVAAAEYLQGTYPDATGFSPRSLRRMRDFYRTYESNQEVMAEAMTIGWTQNVVIIDGSAAPRESVVHPCRPAIWVIQVGVGKADRSLRSFGDSSRLAGRSVLYWKQ